VSPRLVLYEHSNPSFTLLERTIAAGDSLIMHRIDCKAACALSGSTVLAPCLKRGYRCAQRFAEGQSRSTEATPHTKQSCSSAQLPMTTVPVMYMLNRVPDDDSEQLPKCCAHRLYPPVNIYSVPMPRVGTCVRRPRHCAGVLNGCKIFTNS
jgi:hypothetical protein